MSTGLDRGLAAGKRWYLVYAKPRQEEIAKVNLERQGYVTYLPKTRQRRKRMGKPLICVEPLFPRYLFIALDVLRDNWAPIRSTIGVSGLVRFGAEPAVVPTDLVDMLRSRDDAEGVQQLPPTDFREGDRVRVGEGPLAGYEGLFLARSGRDRVTILLDIVGKQTRVIASSAALERAD